MSLGDFRQYSKVFSRSSAALSDHCGHSESVLITKRSQVQGLVGSHEKFPLTAGSGDFLVIQGEPGRKPGIFGRRFRPKLRPRLGVIETPSGDGMTTK